MTQLQRNFITEAGRPYNAQGTRGSVLFEYVLVMHRGQLCVTKSTSIRFLTLPRLLKMIYAALAALLLVQVRAII